MWEADGVTLATIYDVVGAVIPNPITGSLEGFVQFWAAEGEYRIEGASGGEETEVWSWVAGVDLSGIESDISDINDRIDALSAGVGTAMDVSSIVIDGAVQAIDTNGYYAAGDGGGAQYVRVALEPSHAGKLQSADGAWWELVCTQIAPEMFGAVSSSVVSSQSAFDAMLGYAMERGWCTCNIAKVYNLPDGILIDFPVVLDGHGTGEVQVGWTKVVSPEGENAGIRIQRTTDVTITGLRVILPPSIRRLDNIATLYTIYSDNIVFEDVFAKNGQGIWFYGCNDVRTTRVKIEDSVADGIHFAASHRCMADGCYIVRCNDDALSSTPGSPSTPSRNITFKSCRSVDATRWGGGFSFYSVKGGTITDCHATNISFPVVKLAEFVGGGLCEIITINNVTGTSINMPSVIPNNFWYGTPDLPNTYVNAGLELIEGWCVSVSNVNIQGITSAAAVESGFGVLLGNILRCNMSNVTISETPYEGITTSSEYGNPGQVLITGCLLNAIGRRGIFIGKAGGEIVISSNSIQASGSSDAVRVQGTGPVRVAVTGNTSTGLGGFSRDASTAAGSISANNYP